MDFKIVSEHLDNSLSDGLISITSGVTQWPTSAIPEFEDEDVLLWQRKKAPIGELIQGLPSEPKVEVNYLHHPKLNYVLFLRDFEAPLLVETLNSSGGGYSFNEYEISSVQCNVGFDVEPAYTDILVGGLIHLLLMSNKLSDDIKAMLIENYNEALSPTHDYYLGWSNENHVPLISLFKSHAINDFTWEKEQLVDAPLINNPTNVQGE
jgi:hypothetical protein